MASSHDQASTVASNEQPVVGNSLLRQVNSWFGLHELAAKEAIDSCLVREDISGY